MRRAALAGALAVLLAACSGGGDPYYEALTEAGWREAAPDMTDAEFEDFAEEMAADLCQQVRDDLLDGMSDEQIALRMYDAIDPTSQAGDLAAETASAVLEYRCDATQSDGLKT